MLSRRSFATGCVLSLLSTVTACDPADVDCALEQEPQHATLPAVDASWVIGGVLHVVRGTTEFEQDVATRVWSSPKDLAASWNVANAPFQGTSAPIDAAFQTSTSPSANLVVLRGATKFERQGSVWLPPVNLATDPAWSGPNAPFQGTTAPVNAATLIGDTTLYVFRGDTLFTRLGNSWLAVTTNLAATGWGTTANRPFHATNAPLDTAHYDPVNRKPFYVRGTTAFVSPFAEAPIDLAASTAWGVPNGPFDPAFVGSPASDVWASCRVRVRPAE